MIASENCPGGIEKIVSDSLHAYYETGEAFDHGRCDGPMRDGSNPCPTCQSTLGNFVEAHRFVGDLDRARALRIKLEKWRGEHK